MLSADGVHVMATGRTRSYNQALGVVVVGVVLVIVVAVVIVYDVVDFIAEVDMPKAAEQQ